MTESGRMEKTRDMLSRTRPPQLREGEMIRDLYALSDAALAEVEEWETRVDRLKAALEQIAEFHPIDNGLLAGEVARAALAPADRNAVDYSGPDPSVECAYPGCTRRLRQSAHGTQFCSTAHRDVAPADRNTT